VGDFTFRSVLLVPLLDRLSLRHTNHNRTLHALWDLPRFCSSHQVIPDDIEWITKRAAERGYPIPTAFMSSKPDAGINHKTYGVTSEGVQVPINIQ